MPSNSFLSGIVQGKYDKTTHFTLSFVATLLALTVLSFYWALGIVFGIGIAKEIKDSLSLENRFDIADVLANTIGIGLAAVVWRIFI